MKMVYLHSTAVSTYCGDYKQYQLKQNSVANKVVEKMAKGYTELKSIHNDVDSWANLNNQLVVNLGDAIKLKIANPEIRFFHVRLKLCDCIAGDSV